MKILKDTKKLLLMGLGLALAILLAGMIEKMSHKDHIDILKAYFPLRFSEKFDPRFVYTVGEQIQAEHLFAFHSRTALKSGFSDVMSNVLFDEQKSLVTVDLQHDCRQADGQMIPFQTICEGLRLNLQGTRHMPYASVLEGLKCEEERQRIQIFFKKIPLNLRFLFTLPDLSIFDPSQLPISLANNGTSTGPYVLESVSKSSVMLRLNPHYPKSLRANEVERAELSSYLPTETRDLIKRMNVHDHHMVYFLGNIIESSDVDLLKQKGYQVETFPTEWFAYVSIKSHVNPYLRQSMMRAIGRFRTKMVTKSGFGFPAFSISPSDRDFSLSQMELQDAIGPLDLQIDRNTKFTLSILNSLSDAPFFKSLFVFLKEEFPNMEIQSIERERGTKYLFSKDIDIALALLGISPADPLTHFSFLESVFDEFSGVVSKERIAELSVISDPIEFNRSVKEIEVKAAKSGLIVPIAHFPGIVAYRKDFVRDESKAFGWGIQTWTFRVD